MFKKDRKNLKLDRENLKYENIANFLNKRALGIIEDVDLSVETFVKITSNKPETKIVLERDDKVVLEGVGEIEGIIRDYEYCIKFNKIKYDFKPNYKEYQEYNENYFIKKEIKNTPRNPNPVTTISINEKDEIFKTILEGLIRIPSCKNKRDNNG